MEVMLENHPKTVEEPEVTPMKARKAKAVETRSAVYGRPLRAVRLKIEGALPATARPSVNIKGKIIYGAQITQKGEGAYRVHESWCTCHWMLPTMQT